MMASIDGRRRSERKRSRRVEPDAFHRVELWAVGRQDDERDGRGHGEGAAQVPAGAVEDHHHVGVGRARCCDVVEEDLHRLGVDRGQHEGDVLAGGGPDRSEDVGPPVAELLETGRALAAPPPAMADSALVADPCLVLEPQLDPSVGMAGGGLGYPRTEPPFLKRSCASASR